MPANTNPIFVKAPNISWGVLSTANTSLDGTGSIVSLFTAGAEGSRIEKIRIAHIGSNVQTVLRLFINNGSSNGVADNNSLFYEKTIAQNTVSHTTEQVFSEIAFPDGLHLPSGYKIHATIGTAVASGLKVTVIGGDY